MKVLSLTEKEQVSEFMQPSEFVALFSSLYNVGIAKMPNTTKELSSDRTRKQA